MNEQKNDETALDTVQSLLNELIQKQELLLSNVQEDTVLLANCETVSKVHSTMIRTQQYYKKVLCVKKDLMDMHKQSQKLKDRALKLASAQEALAHKRKQHLEQEERLEQSLIAKPAPSKKSAK